MTEWKPGDVALIPFGAGDETGVYSEEGWLIPGRSVTRGYVCARPIIAIDQVDQLREALAYAQSFAEFQSALREFTNPKPPKPDEPMGLGAVVECDPGIYDEAWAVRVWLNDAFGGRAWDYYDSSGNGGRRHYDELNVTKVLSEGFTGE